MSVETIEPFRVELSRQDLEGVHNGAHEVMDVDFTYSNRRNLAQHFKTQFQDLENSPDATDRANISDRCVWSPGYEAREITINWEPASSLWVQGEKTAHQTILTEYNFKRCLRMLQQRLATNPTIHVLITKPVVQGDLLTTVGAAADEKEKVVAAERRRK